MYRRSVYTAIDVGTTKVCTVIARQRSDGSPEALGVGVAPSNGLSKGTVVDIDEVKEAIAASVREASQGAGISPTPAMLGVSGIHLETLPTSATIRKSGNSLPVSTADLDQVLQVARPSRLPQGKELVHLIAREYVLDGTGGIRNPVGMHTRHLGVNAQSVLSESAPLDNLVKAAEQAGVAVWGLVSQPLASGEAVLSPEERHLGALVVDMGGGTTDLAYFQRGVFWDAQVIPLGGHQFTNDIAVVLGVPYQEAEKAKLTWGSAEPWKAAPDKTLQLPSLEEDEQRQVSHKELCRIIRERAEELLHLIQGKLEALGLERLPLAGAVLTGGAAALPGLESLAKDILGGPVRIATPRYLEGAAPLLTPAFASSVRILLWAMHHRVPRREPRGNGRAAVRAASRLMQHLASVGIRVSFTSPSQSR